MDHLGLKLIKITEVIYAGDQQTIPICIKVFENYYVTY